MAKLTNQNILDLNSSLDKVKNLTGAKFAYFVAKNSSKIKSEVETFKEMLKTDDSYNEYEKERIELVELHAKKDDKNKPVVVGNEYQIENQKEFDAQFELLKGKHQETLDARKKQVDDFNNFLKEESKLELHTIEYEDVPTNITGDQLTGIISLVEGEPK